MSGELLIPRDQLSEADEKRRTLADLLVKMARPEFEAKATEKFLARGVSNVSGATENLAVLPCSFRLQDMWSNIKMGNRNTSIDELRKAMRTRCESLRKWLNSQFDFVLIDCPPYFAEHVRILMRVVDNCVIPCVPDPLSCKGTQYLVDYLARKKFRAQPIGTVWNLVREVPLMTEIRSSPPPGIPTPFSVHLPNAVGFATALAPNVYGHQSSRWRKWLPGTRGDGKLTLIAKYGKEIAPRLQALAIEIGARAMSVNEKSTGQLKLAKVVRK